MNNPISEKLTQELHPRQLAASLMAGVITGILEVPIEISFAALIFTGVLAPYLSNGIGFFLMGAIIFSVMSALLSSYPGSVSLPQDTSAVIIAVMAAGITASMIGASQHTMFLTVLATITIASLITGFSLLVMGIFHLEKLIRYIPYPVIGGFLAGTGLLLFFGGLSVSTGASISFATLPLLFQSHTLATWLP